eukprot:CAMPEP_0206505428 /NCGR_PEP_ID=MMETSP0324_2-20121206/56123_1 /ASSEMBLY_ACC=CAM_ASM_000836 /TAXON_ID=2866 /ORGANISM="Crypthecodinium cohnii, Strain Seligo" /LENGTH=50 /DNA_ID=CAMNT_0053994883 /DNA_START=141 /DNA_END=293 /DNA_ORIENTATION=+
MVQTHARIGAEIGAVIHALTLRRKARDIFDRLRFVFAEWGAAWFSITIDE